MSRRILLIVLGLESCHQKLVRESVSVTVGNSVILPCRGLTKPSSSLEVVFELNGSALKASGMYEVNEIYVKVTLGLHGGNHSLQRMGVFMGSFTSPNIHEMNAITVIKAQICRKI